MQNNPQEEGDPEEIPFVGMFATASVLALACIIKRDDF
jgi:hypothetical protein